MAKATDPLMKPIMALLFVGAAVMPGVASAAGGMPALMADRWVNSTPLTPQALRGKVVLVDFWEFTCVNWLRTAPYVKAWNRDYAQAGLVVIGVHTPEFEFSQRAENVDRGVRDFGLTYPIAIDNSYAIWNAFDNNAWPATYLFDSQGRVVNRWLGEGSYDEIESEIRRLLVAADPAVKLPAVSPEVQAFKKTGFPDYSGITDETYVGADRGARGAFKLEGDWVKRPQYIELHAGEGSIVIPFTGGEANLVVQPGTSGRGTLTVLLDGKPVGAAHGADVDADGVAHFDRSGMIRLVAGASRKKHVLTLVARDPGFQAYSFTFGP